LKNYCKNVNWRNKIMKMNENNVFRKCINLFIISLFIGTSFLSSVIAIGTESGEKINTLGETDKLDQQQIDYCGYGWSVWGTNVKLAQSFIPSMEFLTSVELRLWKRTLFDISPEGLQISICDSLNGEDLTCSYISAADIVSNESLWYEFNFPDIHVIPGKTYYIIWEPDGAKGRYRTFFWGYGYNNPYTQGSAYIFLESEWNEHEPKPGLDFCFKTYGDGNQNPKKPNKPSGSISGKVGKEYIYSSITTDPNGDKIYYMFSWGDGTTSNWLGPNNSGEIISEEHAWNGKNSYEIKVKAKDEHGLESPWSDSLIVSITNKKSYIETQVQVFLENYQNLFSLLKKFSNIEVEKK